MHNLTAYTDRDYVFHAGRHARPMPAGTEVTVRVSDLESGAETVIAHVAGRERITHRILVSRLIPA